MKKQDMIKLAIIGMMAGATSLGAQGMNQPAPNGSCHNNPPPAPTQPANPDNSMSQPAPSGSCKTAQSRKFGVDTSIRSSYSNSNEKKAKATKQRSFDQKCGTNSCNGDEGTGPMKPQPQPNARQSRANTPNRSTAK